MPQYAPAELQMWEDLPPERSQSPTDSEINEKYAKRELRIVTETNREQLPNFVSPGLEFGAKLDRKLAIGSRIVRWKP